MACNRSGQRKKKQNQKPVFGQAKRESKFVTFCNHLYARWWCSMSDGQMVNESRFVWDRANTQTHQNQNRVTGDQGSIGNNLPVHANWKRREEVKSRPNYCYYYMFQHKPPVSPIYTQIAAKGENSNVNTFDLCELAWAIVIGLYVANTATIYYWPIEH